MSRSKEILIISTETDKSTDDVLRYLLYYNCNFTRLNETEALIDIHAKLNGKLDVKLWFEKSHIDLKEIRAVWYRRGRINLRFNKIKQTFTKQEKEIYKQYIDFYDK